MGIPYVESPGEAEAQCCACNIAGMCDGVVTEDWDAILFGCKRMLKNFSNKSEVIEINSDALIKSLGMRNRSQLIDLGILLGTDYCRGITGIKPVDIYKKFKAVNFNVRKFLDNLKQDTTKVRIPENFIEEWEIARDYYLNAPVIDPKKIIDKNIKWNEPKYDKLLEYLVNEKGFEMDIIKPRINELKIMYAYYASGRGLVTLSIIRYELGFPYVNGNCANKEIDDPFGSQYVQLFIDHVMKCVDPVGG
jgi:flap endonuclease-1